MQDATQHHKEVARMRILLVEPHDLYAARLERAITRTRGDAELTRARTPVECLTTLAEARFDAIVLPRDIGATSAEDLVAGGGDLLRACPLILITPNRTPAAVASGVRIGAADVLSRTEAWTSNMLARSLDAACNAHAQMLPERRASRRLSDEPRRPAELDPFTGLPGPRCLDRFLASRELRRDRRRSLACVAAELDADVDDSSALRAFADIVRSILPPDATALRDEGLGVIILAPWPGVAHAWRWMESLRALVASHAFPAHDDDALSHTVSLGLAISTPEAFTGETVALAREAALLAREQGGDRACTWQMLAANHLAERLGGAAATLEDRHGQFIRSMRNRLGATQMEHVTTHSRAVQDTADALARAVGVDDEQQRRVHDAALLHDVGKCVIPEDLLAKPAALSYLERSIIDTHADYGAQIGLALGASERTAECVRAHHRRYAPDLADEITLGPAPLEANIVAAADAIATITTGRPYQPARSMDEALFELLRGRGSQFDPIVVDAAIRTRGGTLRKAA